MTSNRIGAIVATWFILAVSQASAATFNLAGNGGLSHRYDFGPIDGIGLGIVAGTIDLGANPLLDTVNVGGTPNQFPKVGQYSGGLGVVNSKHDNSHQVDGYGLNDILLLQFTEDVRIVSAMFTHVSANDGFEFWFDDEGNGSLDGDYVSTHDIPDSLTFAFLGDFVGDLFGFGAVYYKHDFKLKSVTVESVAQVPVPAALPLFGSALLIAGWFGHRRRRRSQI